MSFACLYAIIAHTTLFARDRRIRAITKHGENEGRFIMTDARTAMKKQPSCSVALSLRFAREPEGGYTVTYKDLPELITYGTTLEEALENSEFCPLNLNYLERRL